MKTVEEILPDLIEFRHQLHRIPEIAGQEFKTQKALRDRLAGLDIEVLPPFIGTDTVALLQGRGPGRNVTLRADIDALRVEEETGVPFASEHPGMMHACGHDANTAMLMGAAEVLATRRDEFNGSIRFVWQPGEENQALGRKLIEAGALENPKADIVTALHGRNGLPVGVLSTRDGTIQGSSSQFRIIVHGKGGHSSNPSQAIDPVLVASSIVVELQSIVSRRINPQAFAVLSVCRFSAGQLANVIPSEAVLEGTARSYDPKNDDILENCLRDIVEHVARAHGATVEIDYQRLYPVTVNWPEPTALARKVIRETMGEDCYIELADPATGAEDFAYYLKKYPGVYLKIGTGEDCVSIHHPKFFFPDEALKNGIRYFVEFALAALK